MEFLKIWDLVLRRKRIIFFVFGLFFLTVVIITHVVKPSYRAKALVLLEKNESLTNVLELLALNISRAGMQISTDDFKTDIAMASITPQVKKLIIALKLKNRFGKEITPRKLLKTSYVTNKLFPQPFIKVKQYEEAGMLEISAYSPSAKEAAAMANTLGRLYIEERISIISKEYEKARDFIKTQMLIHKEQYYGALNDYKSFQVEEGVYDLTKQTEELIEKMQELKTSYEENEIAVTEYTAKQAKAESELVKHKTLIEDSKEYADSEIVQGLKEKLNELSLELRKKSVDITKEHPDYKQLEKQIETVKDKLKKEAKVVLSTKKYVMHPLFEELAAKMADSVINLEAAKAKRKVFKTLLDDYEKTLKTLPAKTLENTILNSNVTQSQDLYEQLKKYLVKLTIAQSIALSDLRIVEPADVPDEVYFPKKVLNYFLGIIFGLVWALVSALLIDYIDNSIQKRIEKTKEKIEEEEEIKEDKSVEVEPANALQRHVPPQIQPRQVPLIGTIHRTRYLTSKAIISSTPTQAQVLKEINVVGDGILHIQEEMPFKSCLITSSLALEGKTSLCVNLAVTFCMRGFKVLIVDFNLVNPDMHNFFNIPSSHGGLLDVVGGKIALDECIVESKVEGLYILTAGNRASDAFVADSVNLDSLFTKLKDLYDLVIVDTPALFASNDVITVGRHVDCAFYIVESGKVTAMMMEKLISVLNEAALDVRGYILNKVVKKVQK
ncbi:MAG: AAA family ATPase [Candidatus Magnetoovum sp. WYHC-5]|nr:AAA family ATPase [Candidatus Magnetoovum sp. WYHC-5]